MKNKIAWIIILFASLFFSSCERSGEAMVVLCANPVNVVPLTVIGKLRLDTLFQYVAGV
jgi:hypothetical protein